MPSEMNLPSCPICAADSVRVARARLNGYRAGSIFEIRECASCGVAFAEPRIDDPELYESIYRDIDSVPGYGRYLSYREVTKTQLNSLDVLAELEESYWAVRETLRREETRLGRKPRVAEVGCGMGYLTRAISQAGYECVGLDHSRNAIEAASRAFPGQAFFLGDVASASRHFGFEFDVLVACQVIEHIAEPVNFIRSLASGLKKGGALVITTPRRRHGIPAEAWDTDLPPVHWWWFTEEALGGCARAAQLRHETIDLGEFYKHHVFGVPSRKMVATHKKREAVFGANGALLDTDQSRYSLQNTLSRARPRGWIRRQLAGLAMLKAGYLRARDNDTARDVCMVMRP